MRYNLCSEWKTCKKARKPGWICPHVKPHVPMLTCTQYVPGRGTGDCQDTVCSQILFHKRKK